MTHFDIVTYYTKTCLAAGLCPDLLGELKISPDDPLAACSLPQLVNVYKNLICSILSIIP